MKKCKKCRIESNNFCKQKGNKDGFCTVCRVCNNNSVREYVKTRDGLSGKIYGAQITNSKKRGHNPPSYNLKDFRVWLYAQIIFDNLYDKRKESGYKEDLLPSVDRLDDYKGYSFDNIQLMTWKQNRDKSFSDRKNGINNKASKRVVRIDIITGGKVTFYSLKEASRVTGIDDGGIRKCCMGILKKCGGYLWEYY